MFNIRILRHSSEQIGTNGSPGQIFKWHSYGVLDYLYNKVVHGREGKGAIVGPNRECSL